ncbi:MAG: UDP-N-acetylglucosamine 2-epimerase, partial [Defluviitaleaceae bacterium]|nr:UDP-N-acetylglucosamine 2-epimerase [Defluviitaleaceae bacterium]
TDSGGLQEEAAALHKPVVVLRNVTERPEGFTAGTLKLAGTDENTVYNMAAGLLEMGDEYKKMAAAKNPFGDGRASERIIHALLHYFGIIGERPADFNPLH